MGLYFNTHDDDFEDDLAKMNCQILGEPVSLNYDDLKNNNFTFVSKDNKDIYIFDVAGIAKEDLSVKLIENEDFKGVDIKGTTKNEMFDEELSVDYNIGVGIDTEIKEVISKLENGLLYVEIEYQEPESNSKTTEIAIQ